MEVRILRGWVQRRAPTEPGPFLWIRRPEVGPEPDTFLGLKGTGAIWKREHYPSPGRMASLISIFISIKGVLRQGVVKFNFV